QAVGDSERRAGEVEDAAAEGTAHEPGVGRGRGAVVTVVAAAGQVVAQRAVRDGERRRAVEDRAAVGLAEGADAVGAVAGAGHVAGEGAVGQRHRPEDVAERGAAAGAAGGAEGLVAGPTWFSTAPPNARTWLVTWLPVKEQPVRLIVPWNVSMAPPAAKKEVDAELPANVEPLTVSVLPTSLSMAPPTATLVEPPTAWLAVNRQLLTVRVALFWQLMAPPAPEPLTPPAATLPVNVLSLTAEVPRLKRPPPRRIPGPPATWLFRNVQRLTASEAPASLKTPPPTPVNAESPTAWLPASVHWLSVRLPALSMPP